MAIVITKTTLGAATRTLATGGTVAIESTVRVSDDRIPYQEIVAVSTGLGNWAQSVASAAWDNNPNPLGGTLAGVEFSNVGAQATNTFTLAAGSDLRLRLDFDDTTDANWTIELLDGATVVATPTASALATSAFYGPFPTGAASIRVTRVGAIADPINNTANFKTYIIQERSALVAVNLTDAIPAAPAGTTRAWTASGTATVPNAAGTGDISEAPSLRSGEAIAYTVIDTVNATGTYTNTASDLNSTASGTGQTVTISAATTGVTDTNEGNEPAQLACKAPVCAANPATALGNGAGTTTPPAANPSAVTVTKATCTGTETVEAQSTVQAIIPSDLVVTTRRCPTETEFDHTILCDPNNNDAQVIASVQYGNTGVPVTTFYNIDGTPYTGDSTALVACISSSGTESDPVQWCDGGVNLLQWVVKANGEPNGTVFWTNALTGAVVAAPAAPVAGACDSINDINDEYQVLCDNNGTGTPNTRFLRRFTNDGAGNRTVVDTSLDGTVPYVVAGTASDCPSEHESVFVLCDVDGAGVATPFVRRLINHGDGNYDIQNTDLTLNNAYNPTGTVSRCSDAQSRYIGEVCYQTPATVVSDSLGGFQAGVANMTQADPSDSIFTWTAPQAGTLTSFQISQRATSTASADITWSVGGVNTDTQNVATGGAFVVFTYTPSTPVVVTAGQTVVFTPTMTNYTSPNPVFTLATTRTTAGTADTAYNNVAGFPRFAASLSGSINDAYGILNVDGTYSYFDRQTNAVVAVGDLVDCPAATGGTGTTTVNAQTDEIEVLCDTNLGTGAVTQFMRRINNNGSGTRTVTDTTLDGLTAYATTGTVGRCAGVTVSESTEAGCAAGVPWTRRRNVFRSVEDGATVAVAVGYFNSANTEQAAAPAGFTLGACAPATVTSTTPATIGRLRATGGGTVAANKQSVTFVNVGSADAVVQGAALSAGESVSFSGYMLEGGNTRLTLPAIAYVASATAILSISWID